MFEVQTIEKRNMNMKLTLCLSAITLLAGCASQPKWKLLNPPREDVVGKAILNSQSKLGVQIGAESVATNSAFLRTIKSRSADKFTNYVAKGWHFGGSASNDTLGAGIAFETASFRTESGSNLVVTSVSDWRLAPDNVTFVYQALSGPGKVESGKGWVGDFRASVPIQGIPTKAELSHTNTDFSGHEFGSNVFFAALPAQVKRTFSSNWRTVPISNNLSAVFWKSAPVSPVLSWRERIKAGYRDMPGYTLFLEGTNLCLSVNRKDGCTARMTLHEFEGTAGRWWANGALIDQIWIDDLWIKEVHLYLVAERSAEGVAVQDFHLEYPERRLVFK